MKTYKNIIRILTMPVLSLFMAACTDLTEIPYTQLAATDFNNNLSQVEASVKGVYSSFQGIYDWRYEYFFQEVTTDVGVVPQRAGGWNSAGEVPLHEQTWDAQTIYIGRAYNMYSTAIGTANFVIEQIKDTEKYKKEIAEVRYLRAFAYFDMLDLWGAVPIVTVSLQDPNNLAGNQPVAEQRAKVFNLVEQELIAAIKDLPAKKEVTSSYYPRATKESAQALLAKLYLNSEVWSGKSRWNDCVIQCNEVINSGSFQLTPKITDSFVPQNQSSKEIIFSFVKTSLGAGLGFYQTSYQVELAYKYHMPVEGWGGFSVLQDHFESYDKDDFRRSLILQGPQFLDDGSPLYIGATRLKNGDPKNGQFIIYPVINFKDAPTNQGYKSLKYQPDVNQIGSNANNDVVVLRYADVLLTKAEAILRGGADPKGETAAGLINQVRARNFIPAKPIISPTLDDILNERNWEFSMEGKRRQDLIRFGKFSTLKYTFRVNYDAFRSVFPIPQTEIDKNPNLLQNPGYTK